VIKVVWSARNGWISYSPPEEFLRLAPQYRQEFIDSCSKVKADRDQFYKQLQAIQGMTVYQPDANYIFCRLPDHALSGPEVTEKLFVQTSTFLTKITHIFWTLWLLNRGLAHFGSMSEQ
jgi:histidinol-phosphate/aromatic aminotransferase/cobyric acid decarboxylase-like protein